MRKTLKIIFCSLVIVTILTANVFASGWAGYTPNFSDFANVDFSENITSAYSAETLGETIDNAYNLGLFGGAIPFAVLGEQVNEENWNIAVLCAAPILLLETGAENITKTTVYGIIDLTGGTVKVTPSQEGTVTNICFLITSGDYWYGESLLNGYELRETEKIFLLKSPEGDWYYDDNSSYFAQFYNVNASENETIGNINAKYMNALESYTPPSEPSEPPVILNYILDIPSIITAIPNGAKQIINNAFGFEVFGINVAGLLSVILIVTIISFIVKWLMSR